MSPLDDPANSPSQSRREQLNRLSHASLVELVLGQDQQISALQAMLTQARQVTETYEERLDEAERQGKSGHPPFAIPKEKRQANPKKPGRPKGHKGAFRQAGGPPDQALTVPPVSACPGCGHCLQGVKVTPVIQVIEELEMRVVRTRLTTYSAECPRCQQAVRSQHPMQVTLATGAAGVHLGRGALSLAVAMNKQYGLTARKTCRLMQEIFGLPLTPGGLMHANHRLAERLRSPYEELFTHLRQAPVLHLDETSWYVGAPQWFLHVACTPDTTLYRVRPTRNRQTTAEVVGPDYQGVLISDCLNLYDEVCARQQKCHAHHGQAIKKTMHYQPPGEHGYALEWKNLLMASRALGQARSEMPASDYASARQAVEKAAKALLWPPRRQPDEERLRKRLFKQRAHLFTFLDHPGVPPTNNLAERQLRPAVVSRKISCGNRTAKGAKTWARLTSLAVTDDQRGLEFRERLKSVIKPQAG